MSLRAKGLMLLLVGVATAAGCASGQRAPNGPTTQVSTATPGDEWVEVSDGPSFSQSSHSPEVVQTSYFPQPGLDPGAAPLAGPTPLAVLIQYARANNPQIQAARAHARSLGARVPQAASLPDPQLMTNVFLEEIQTAAGPQEVALSLSQKFPWFGKRALRSQVADHDAMAAYARATATELKVLEQLKRAYFDLFFLQHAISETQRLRPRLKEVVEIARTKYETALDRAGLESVRQAQMEVAKLDVRLVQLEHAKRRAQARLAGVLHLAPDTRIEATEQVPPSPLVHQVDLLVQLAERYQPELDARRREVSRDRSVIAAAERDYWPDVTVGFNWYDIGSSGLSPIANGRDAVALGVGVNLPIYRGRLDAAVREANCRAMASRRRLAAERDRVAAEVEALYAEFQEHHRVAEILESEIVPLAERTFELAPESYRNNKIDFIQLIDAYRTLLEHRIELYRHRAMREQTVASLERAVGTSVSGGGLSAPAVTEPTPDRLP